MFGIGMPELLLILVVALIVIGPKKLPDLAKSLGKAMREFRNATAEIKDSLNLDDDVEELKTNLKKTAPPQPSEMKTSEPLEPTREEAGPNPSDPYALSSTPHDNGAEKHN